MGRLGMVVCALLAVNRSFVARPHPLGENRVSTSSIYPERPCMILKISVIKSSIHLKVMHLLEQDVHLIGTHQRNSVRTKYELDGARDQ